MKLFYRFAQTSSFLYFRLFHRFEVMAYVTFHQGSFILASNHSSYFDPPALGCKLPRNLHYFARDSLFFWPLGVQFIILIQFELTVLNWTFALLREF